MGIAAVVGRVIGLVVFALPSALLLALRIIAATVSAPIASPAPAVIRRKTPAEEMKMRDAQQERQPVLLIVTKRRIQWPGSIGQFLQRLAARQCVVAGTLQPRDRIGRTRSCSGVRRVDRR